MKNKSSFYFILGILGIALMVAAVVLDGRVSDAVDGPLMGVGAGLIGLGFSMWKFCRWQKKEPEMWRQYEIDSNDERNVIIRLKAKAAAGEVLQWTVMAAAWVAICLDAPLWFVLATVGVFLFKTILEICLMSRYQKEM